MDTETAKGRAPTRRALRVGAVDLTLCVVLASCAGRSDAIHAPAPEAAVASVDARARPSGGTPAEACVAVMHRTRECREEYVPGILALRIRLDQPPGIAERYEAEGESAMLELAHSQFSRDWSDEVIIRNCADLSRRPAAEQERIIASDRRCLETLDCSGFTACDLAHKEKRWTELP
jgi:hypothetical protein